MALIWRVATKAARDSMLSHVHVNEILKQIGTGWELPPGVEPSAGMTARELAAWLRDTARPRDGAYEITRGAGRGQTR
jgi:hypothetical protein